MPPADFAVAVDIGGTFTDITLADHATGRQWRAKTPSTPADLSQAFLTGVDAAAPGTSLIEVVASALRSAALFFPDDLRSHSRLRQSVIDQNPALQERELHKLATLATMLADALGARGVDELAATLAAQLGVTVFAVAFTQWIREGEERSFAEITADVLRELLTVTGQATASRRIV